MYMDIGLYINCLFFITVIMLNKNSKILSVADKISIPIAMISIILNSN
jgi:hypothetical protein